MIGARCRDLRLLVGRLRLRITLLPLRIAGLRLGLPRRRIGLDRGRRRGDAGLGRRRLAGRGCGRAAAELPQALLELAVAILQFLVLAGELPQLVLEPLDPHIRVGIVGLRLDRRGALRGRGPRERYLCDGGLRRQGEHRGNRHGADRIEKSE